MGAGEPKPQVTAQQAASLTINALVESRQTLANLQGQLIVAKDHQPDLHKRAMVDQQIALIGVQHASLMALHYLMVSVLQIQAQVERLTAVMRGDAVAQDGPDDEPDEEWE